jgi:putative membrane protein
MKYFSIFFKSIFIGIGAIAPGLSGGALAMIFGLYERLVNAVSQLFSKLRENFVFLALVGSGAIFGVVSFAGVQRYLIGNYMMQTMYVFAGLVIGTLPQLFKKGNKKGFDKKYLIGFVITFAIGVILSLLGNNEINVQDQEVVLNFKNIVFLFLAGAVLAGSLVIPGISGTVLLMLIGAYGIFINAVADLKDVLFILESPEMFMSVIDNLLLLAPIGLGLVVGAVFYAKLMAYLLDQHYSYTFYAVLGFVTGSLFELIPGVSFDKTGISSMIFGLIACVISLQVNNKWLKDVD